MWYYYNWLFKLITFQAIRTRHHFINHICLLTRPQIFFFSYICRRRETPIVLERENYRFIFFWKTIFKWGQVSSSFTQLFLVCNYRVVIISPFWRTIFDTLSFQKREFHLGQRNFFSFITLMLRTQYNTSTTACIRL